MGFDFGLGGLFGAIGSSVGAGISARAQNKIVDKQIAAQKEENRLTREYNLDLAQMQNQWNIDQWKRENEYNLPKNVMSRMIEAGYNPDLMYKDSGGVGLSAASPELTAGAPAIPTDLSAMSRSVNTYGESIKAFLGGLQQMANIDLTTSEAKKNQQTTENLKVENNILSADALTRAVRNEQSIEFTRSQIYLNHSIAELNHSQQERIAADINQINASVDKIYSERDLNVAKIRDLDSQIVQRRFDAYLRSAEFDLNCRRFLQYVKESDSRINLNLQQVKDILATQSARIYNLNAGAAYNEKAAEKIQSEMGILSVEFDTMKFNLDVLKDFEPLQRRMLLIQGYANAFGQAVGGVGQALFGVGKFKSSFSKPPASSNPGTINVGNRYSTPSY